MTEEQQAIQTSVDEGDWSSLLAQHQETYKKAERGGDWSPPEGDYHVSLSKLRRGKDKKGIPYWAIYGKLMDGVGEDGEPLTDREFQLNFFSLARETSAGQMKDWASKFQDGATIDDLAVADAVLVRATEQELVLAITLKKTERNGRTFPNVYINEVIQDDLSETQEQTPEETA